MKLNCLGSHASSDNMVVSTLENLLNFSGPHFLTYKMVIS